MKDGGSKLGKSFVWLNATQFLGALNDNFFKMLLVGFFINQYGLKSASSVAALAGAVFVAPFLIFMAFAGKLADRFSKSNIVVWVKAAEVVVMTAGCIAFAAESRIAVYAVLFAMGTQSAFFGPSKYGIVPELVSTAQVSRANGVLEALTYLAIVIGTALGPTLSQFTGGLYALLGLICVGIAAAGLASSLQIGRTEAAGGTGGASIFFIRDIWRTLWSIHRKKDLLLAVFGSAYFMLVGGFIYINVIPYGIERLGFVEAQGGYLFIPAAVGIGIGAFLAGRLSGRNVEFGVVPLGALGLTLASLSLGLISGGIYVAFAFAFLMGFSAGLFIVPIHAFIQLESPRRRRGQVLAASSFLGWTGVLSASGLIYLCSKLGMSAGQVFIVLGAMTGVLTVVTMILLPDFMVRFVLILLTKLLYRIRVSGAENIPVEGGALLVANHASWADAVLVGSTQQRRVRFIMDKEYYKTWWLKPIFKLMRVIPISADDPPKKIIASLRQARAAMDDGFLVCVFAEGAMTRTGMPRSFRGGFERIVKGSDYPIIPIHLGGMWGSIFSCYYGKPLSTLPKKFPYPVSIDIGEPMPTSSTTGQVRQEVCELSCEYFEGLKPSRRSLAEHFVRVARKNWRKHCIFDSMGKRLKYGQALVSTVAISEVIEELTQGHEKIAILLPPSAGAALANLAVTMLGKVSVNLNYSTSVEVRREVVRQCEIKHVISSRAFVEKVGGLDGAEELVFLEDIVRQITTAAKVKAYLKARLLPRRILAHAHGFRADDLAAVIFTSGSSGLPKGKGVMLSHHNILSNIEALRSVFRIRANDNLCGVLPFFHSFGFTCTLWLPLVSGVSASYVPNPIDGKTVGRTARENRSTLLFATPTFLLNYVRKAEREDFASLRSVVVGAEKLKESVRDSFETKFGIRPLEGYGATELSPVASLNVADVESEGVYQVGTKPGAVGHPIPGVAVRIVDIDTGEPLPAGQAGLLMVKGPNIMLGYLNMEKQSAEVVKDGWYNTGDVAKADEDGFITLTDRLSRFSKIGGEMVPHTGLEQVYLDALGSAEQVVAVTSVPNAKKGEELVVLYLEDAGDAERLHKIAADSDLPNMWKPRRNNYIKVDAIPALGSGKLDVMGLRKMAMAAKKDSQQQ